MSRRRRRLVGVATVAVWGAVGWGVSGCGVGTDAGPRAIDPAAANQPPVPASGAAGAPLYFVREGHLQPVLRRTRDDDRSRLAALLAGVSRTEAAAGLRNAVPATMDLRDVSRNGRVLTVDLTGDLGEASGTEQTLAVAQIVFTATGTRDGAAAVRLLVDGRPVQVPRADGSLDSSELNRADFAGQAPLEPTAPARSAPPSAAPVRSP